MIAAGITWVGPAPESIEQMGSKIESKKLMDAAGVPVLTNHTAETATETDLPLLVKASSGGGGRGMRIVRTLSDLPTEIAAAEAEAESAFGDGTVFVEPYVEQGRHVEVQVLGHRDGVLVLGERDCSLQRRHQKVIEEAPAPNLADATRHGPARSGSGSGSCDRLPGRRDGRVPVRRRDRAVLLPGDEHPAPGRASRHRARARRRPRRAADRRRRGAVDSFERVASVGAASHRVGHAIEARLYAEDPAHDWQPQSGLLTRFDVPGVAGEFDLLNRPGLRLDSGFEAGNEVGTHYDAMLAKVIAWAPTRAEAARKLADALSRARLHGVTTNRELLVASLRDGAFLEGDVSTDFFERRGIVPTGEQLPPDPHLLFAAAVALAERDRAERRTQAGTPVAWRNVVSQPQRTVFADCRRGARVEWYGGRDGYSSRDGDVRVVSAAPDCVTIEVDRISTRVDVAVGEASPTGVRHVEVDSRMGSLHLRVLPRFVDPADVVTPGSLLAPMPGTVIGVPLEAGADVKAGQTVLVLEAMKMQHTISAPTDGVLSELAVAMGQQVSAGEVLAVVTDPEQTDPEQADPEQADPEGDQP